ncbi:DUF5336 domain-containing protein [Mycobacterium hubeiense]|uniref:DUF5336 domain-containing protein n=1 Tax=Mycobacterium hubeiense TaxID=1867256 RepID=UPI000C7F3166|nr:DUF5336 domain-containing protein [Mycobacterium sp. QGD 101]
MTYPPGPPGSPGYPPAQQSGQQPTTQFSAPTQQFGKIGEPAAAAPAGPSKLPVYLTAAVAVLGLAVYLANFLPMFTITNSDFLGLGEFSGTSLGIGLAVLASIVAALFAGISLLPKQNNFIAVVAVFAVVAFLLVLSELINKPSGATVDIGLYLLIAFTALQALAAVAVLLFDAGVITPPTPRPKYEQQQYGQYGGPGQYYGQQHGGPQQHQLHQQRPGYPSQYGQYGQTGGFSGAQQSGPPTPPTGFPTYGQPQQSSGSAPTAQPQQQSSSQPQSGPAPS